MNKEQQLEKKKQKELARKIKNINRSLTFLSKKSQEKTGILAYQKDDGVFLLRNNTFAKIYAFKLTILENKKVALIRSITERFTNRIRFTINVKNNNGIDVVLNVFMTVRFEAISYYEVKRDILNFETKLDEICRFLNISFDQSSIDNTLTYINMNITNELKKIKISEAASKNMINSMDNIINEAHTGKFIIENKEGYIYIGKTFPDNIENINAIYHKITGQYFIVIDFQSHTDDEKELFEYVLKKQYADSKEKSLKSNNLTYMIIAIWDTDKAESNIEELLDNYATKGILMTPMSGRESIGFLSGVSLGLIDYHAMRNASADIIGNLLF